MNKHARCLHSWMNVFIHMYVELFPLFVGFFTTVPATGCPPCIFCIPAFRGSAICIIGVVTIAILHTVGNSFNVVVFALL